MLGTPKYHIKKTNIKLPKIRGFAIDSIQIIPNIQDHDLIQKVLSSKKSILKEHKATSPNLPETENPLNQMLWRLNSDSKEKHSSPPSFSNNSSNTSISSIGKYLRSRQNSLNSLKRPRNLDMSHCDSCNISKAKIRIFSTKSSKQSPSLIQLTSNRIKKCLFQIKGSL